MSERKVMPFYKSIVKAIIECTEPAELDMLGQLILITEITENHEEIMVAWANKRIVLGMPDEDSVYDSIVDQM